MNHLKFAGIAPWSLSLAIATVVLSLTITEVQASTFAYEGFDYEPEDRDNSLLNGLPGQSGLDGGFGWLPYKNEAPSATHFQTTGLSYTDGSGNRLLTSGRSGALVNQIGEHGSFRFINTSQPGFSIPTLTARDPNLGDSGSQTKPGLGVDGTTVWLGFLMGVPTTSRANWNEKYAGLSLFYDDYINGVGTGPFPPSRSNERLFIGSPYGQPDRPLNFGIDHPGAASPLFTNASFSDSEAFLSLRIDFGAGASDRVRLWVNPTLDTDPTLNTTPDIDYIMPFDFQFNRIGIFGNSPFDDPNLIEFDEIRLGTSFSDVAPKQVSEPALGTLLFICLAGLFALKHQRKSLLDMETKS